MSGFDPETRRQFEVLHAAGMQAKADDDHEGALAFFKQADLLAQRHGDEVKRLHALNPKARALWTLGRYDEATEELTTAAVIANEHCIVDEAAIALSNLGRLAAIKIVRIIPSAEVSEALRDESVQYFANARQKLRRHPHYYYRYANAQHGSPIAALAGEHRESAALLSDGMSVAFEISPQPYDQVKTYTISPKGLSQMELALALLANPDSPGLRHEIIDQIR